MVLNEYIERVATKVQLSASTDKLRIKDYINIAIKEIFQQVPDKLYKEEYIDTVGAVTSGTVSVTNGSATVTGSSTAFTSSMVGRKIRVGIAVNNYRYYLITAVASTTSLTIAETYGEDTATSQAYIIYEDVYNLPDDFYKPYAVACCDVQMRRLEEWDMTRSQPGIERTNADQPTRYRINEIVDTPYELTTGAVIDFVSSSASDTTQTATVYGLVGSNRTSEVVTLTGTSTASTTATFAKVYYIQFSAVTVGNITVSYSGTTIATLLPEDKTLDLVTRYYQIAVYPIPKDVYPILVKYYRDIQTLEDDADYIKLLDPTYDSLIIDRARIEKLIDYGDDKKWTSFLQRWQQQLFEKIEVDRTLSKQDLPPTMGFGEMRIDHTPRRIPWYLPGGDRYPS